jgi:hypothetical protein
MDSPIVTRLFRELFRHPACQSRRSLSRLKLASQYGPTTQRRQYAVRKANPKEEKSNESRWQQRTNIYPEDRSDEFVTYPFLTAQNLRTRTQRPKKARMLLRDFIDGAVLLSNQLIRCMPSGLWLTERTDSLYNPSYGYFSTQAVIFSPGEPFDFNAYEDESEFYKQLGLRYRHFEDGLDRKEGVNPTRQLWHTPTELFQPYYGEAIARYLISNYRLTTYPYDDLIIYEMGAGRGTLMLNILDYIRDADPMVYERTRFRIIEISTSLASLQQQQLLATARSRGHASRVEIINKSIFDWTECVPSPCFFLAMEVFDNFAHDCIRYDLVTEEPLQGQVLIDGDGEFHEFYTHGLDPVAARYFRVRHAATGGHYPLPYPTNSVLRYLRSHMPFMGNLSRPEYVPTTLMLFFDVLDKFFPAHRLLTSDFHSLPDTIKGLNAPVVQTRFERTPVPVTTPLVSLPFSPLYPICIPTPQSRGQDYGQNAYLA